MLRQKRILLEEKKVGHKMPSLRRLYNKQKAARIKGPITTRTRTKNGKKTKTKITYEDYSSDDGDSDFEPTEEDVSDISDDDEEFEELSAGSGKGSKGKRASPKSRSAKAGLQFPVGRMQRYLRKKIHTRRVGGNSAVYTAAVLEYLCAELLELAGSVAKDAKKKRITPRFLQVAVLNDEEMNKLIGTGTIASGGVLPNIHAVLLAKKSGSRKSRKAKKKTPSQNSEESFEENLDVPLEGGGKRRHETMNIYIYKVLKQVHPDTGISKKGMKVVNNILMDIFEKIATEADKLVQKNKKHTISSRDIQMAVRLVVPNELAKHAVSEGTKAVTKFTSV